MHLRTQSNDDRVQIIAQSLSFINSWLTPDGKCGEAQIILIVSNSQHLDKLSGEYDGNY